MLFWKHKPPDQGIIWKGELIECWFPQYMQPHLPYNPRHLPVIPIKVGWQSADYNFQPYPSDYWWICSQDLLWSCFKKWGLVVQRRGDC